jgi:putative endonuclease
MSKKDGQWYIGSTKNMQKRILTHNAGNNLSTKKGVPWGIIYCEVSVNKFDARAREKYLKSGQGRRYLKNRLKFFFAV